MTTASTARKAGPLLGNGSTTAFPFAFKVFSTSDIQVVIANSLGIETVLVLDTDYSVTLNSNQDTSPGGTVTYPLSGSALPTGSVLSIIGDLDYDQPLDLPSGGNFSPLALENQLDRTVMQIQQLRENIGRALLVPATSSVSPSLPAPEANQLIGWDASGNNLQNLALEDLATGIAYGTFRYDVFSGDGTSTQFTPSANPATIANLDVAVDGVTLMPGTDYTLVSGVVVFTVAPSNGAEILVRYGEAMTSAPGDAADISFHPAGTGAVTATVQAKLREVVSVKDFGALGNGSTNDTAAFSAATATNQPIFVPQSSSFYSLTSLTDAQRKWLHGPGVVKVSGTQVQISAAPYTNNDSAHIRVYNQDLQPAKWSSVDGSLRNGAVSINATRTGGYGSYGLTLTEYLISDSLPAGEFDVGITTWVTAQNLGGGQVFGAWAGANTPSTSLSQTFSSGAVIGQETNVGHRWADFGLLNEIGATRYTVGHQIVPDVLPALDGATASIYPGSFAEVIAPSVHGHKWWTGWLCSADAIVPGGRVFNIRGGSVVGNATGVVLRATDYFTRGIDFSGATISTQAILLGSSHTISWGGSSMNGTATTFGLSTGSGTGEAGLYASNYSYLAMCWSSSGSAARLGFFGAAATTKPTVTGSRSANAALASLLTALANLGLVTDSTS